MFSVVSEDDRQQIKQSHCQTQQLQHGGIDRLPSLLVVGKLYGTLRLNSRVDIQSRQSAALSSGRERRSLLGHFVSS